MHLNKTYQSVYLCKESSQAFLIQYDLKEENVCFDIVFKCFFRIYHQEGNMKPEVAGNEWDTSDSGLCQ